MRNASQPDFLRARASLDPMHLPDETDNGRRAMHHKARLTAVVLCVVLFGGALMRIAHLRSIHRTPGVGDAICGGELIPCEALGFGNLTAGTSIYFPCREAEQPLKHSSRFFEDMELAMLRKVDQAQCAVQVSLSRAVMGR